MIHLKILLLALVPALTFAKILPDEKQPKHKKTNIVNGSIVTLNSQFPAQVLITGGEDGGGTIIAKRWILTAAHVATNSNLQFYAGVLNRNNLGVGQNRIQKQVRRHPSYNGSLSDPMHDVALIEVTEPFVYGTNVNDIKLASESDYNLWNVNQLPTVSGFGKTSTNGNLSNELRKTEVKVTQVNTSSNKIRAGGNQGNDSCKGDSGGPLTANNIQIGVVSSGGNCGGGGDYMMVSKYLDFITQTIYLLGTPDFVCGNTTFENLGKLPNGVSFQWTASPASLFTVSSGSGLTFTTAKNGTNYGEGTITLSVITPSGTYVHNKKVWVGRPAPATFITDGSFAISGNTATICRTFGYCMTAKADTVLQSSSNSPNTAPISTFRISDLASDYG